MNGKLGKSPVAVYCDTCRKKIDKNSIVTSVTMQPYQYNGTVCQKIKHKYLELNYSTLCEECADRAREYLIFEIHKFEQATPAPDVILPEPSEEILKEAESLDDITEMF